MPKSNPAKPNLASTAPTDSLGHASTPATEDEAACVSVNVPPVIGIGASAGGLEALEQFFSPIPADCGVAFVVIQHLDPTQQGILPD